MEDGKPLASGRGTDPKEEDLDQGRRYWKAAIAHLPPEKREAAWEFYLDRLESSAAADTLGGVMLLLEAHLAFFDDLPARLAVAAQQMHATINASGGGIAGGSLSPETKAASTGGGPASSVRRAPDWVVAVLSATVGALLAGVAAFSRQRSQVAPAISHPPKPPDVLLTHPQEISVEPWLDSAAHRQRGCVVCFDRAAWSECTMAGGAKVYVLSPVEEVRRDLESLRRTPPPSIQKVP